VERRGGGQTGAVASPHLSLTACSAHARTVLAQPAVVRSIDRLRSAT